MITDPKFYIKVIRKHHSKFFWSIFIPAMIVVELLAIVMLLSIFQISKKSHDVDMVASEQLMVQVHRNMITSAIDNSVELMILFSELPVLNEYVNDPTRENKSQLMEIIREFSTLSPYYDQIRLLDDQGYEVIRINVIDGVGEAVVENDLEFKGDNDYFNDLNATTFGQVYISPTDLKHENGQFEIPYKPTIHIGIPLYTKNGERFGSILINLNILILTDQFVLETQTDSIVGNVNLIDGNGQYLFNESDPDSLFGSILPERADRNISVESPDVWDALQSQPKGYVRTNEALYTFDTIDLSEKLYTTAHGRTYSIISESPIQTLLLTLDNKTIDRIQSDLLVLKNIMSIVLLIVVPLLVYSGSILASVLNENRIQLEYFSTHDPLTGLGNRRMLNEVFEEPRKKQTKLGMICYFDLDGFKTINDMYGHSAGDAMLTAVSENVTTILRKGDMIARIGGDEFVIVTSEILGAAEAEHFGRRIIDAVEIPLAWKGHTLRISASVGIFKPVGEAYNLEEAIERADQAMYQGKATGKGKVVIGGS